MVLVDTSVWVAHLRQGGIGLETLINEGRVCRHTFIIGELACGNLENRFLLRSLLPALPQAICAEHVEVLQFIENYRLMGKGLGYLDMHILASAKLTKVQLWTLDQKLSEVAEKLGLAP